jgi:hypothetical protein
MEKKLNKKIESYLTEFKDNIRNKIIELKFNNEKDKINDLLEYTYEYQRLVFNKDDFVKRKRIKNTIPTINRCSAKRASGEQCTRRRKKECEFCGTHSKGTPHGHFQENEVNIEGYDKMEVFAEEIKGIVYYIDKYNNVYNTEEILKEKENPQIIAKWIKHNGVYTIPELGLV